MSDTRNSAAIVAASHLGAGPFGSDLSSRLFGPCERWGWEYVDPGHVQPYPALHRAPRWDEPFQPDTRNQLGPDNRPLGRVLLRAGALTGLAVGLLLVTGGDPMMLPVFAIGFVVLAAIWFVPIARASMVRTRYLADRTALHNDYQRALRAWEDARTRWNLDETSRLNSVPLYFPVEGVSQLLNVFGGAPDGWAAFLTTMGMGTLHRGTPLVVLDLSESDVALPLRQLAAQQRVDSRELILPQELDRADPLAAMSPEDVSEVVAEALHARRGTGELTLRNIDADVLHAVADRLDAPMSVSRLAAGLRVLQGSYDLSDRSAELSPAEQSQLSGYVDQVRDSPQIMQEVQDLRHTLESLSGSPTLKAGGDPVFADLARPGLTVLNVQDVNRRRKDLVDRLVIEALIHRLRREGRSRTAATIVVVSADHIGRETLEQLRKATERSEHRLVVMLEHLSQEFSDYIGSARSASMFMQLKNAQEGARAAEHIGRGHTFKLTQLSRQVGTSESQQRGSTHGTSVATAENSGSSSSQGPGGGSSGNSQSVGVTESSSRSTSVSDTLSKSWADTTTKSRVYEFAVEPTEFADMEETAFILEYSAGGRRRVVAGSCDPGLALLDRVAPAGLHAKTVLADSDAMFINDRFFQYGAFIQRLNEAGYLVERREDPARPFLNGWTVTGCADGRPVVEHEVMKLA